MKPFHWTCPFCERHATIGLSNYVQWQEDITKENADGPRAVIGSVIICPNESCKKLTLTVSLFELDVDTSSSFLHKEIGEALQSWDLIPSSKARTFPEYVPKPIIDDYQEACKIVQLSPKASATLSRRCLQGMIRDFFGISKARLIDEINAIKERVDPLVWDSIDAIRQIGNIGAHMEKDINLIIDVDPKEAEILISLIEQLIADWYINRHQRQQRLKSIITIKEEKRKQQEP